MKIKIKIKNTFFSENFSSGFTLIEFLIVIALLSIAAAFFIPQYSDYSKREVLKNAAQELMVHLQSARNKALSGIQAADQIAVAYQVLYFSDYQATGIYAEYEDGSLNSSPLEQLTLPAVLQITWPADNPRFLVPTGKLSGSERTITVCYSGIGKHTITLSPTGLITLGDREEAPSCP